MPWNDYPLRSITIPADHEVGSSYIYIGQDDPQADANGTDAAIVFHFGQANSAFFIGVTNEFGVTPDDGHFFITGTSDEELNPLTIIDVDWSPGLLFASTTFGDDGQYSSTRVQGYAGLNLDVIDEQQGSIVAGGQDLRYGVVSSQQKTTSGAAITAETVIITIPSTRYDWKRAYEVRIQGGFTPSTATAYADVRLKKTNTAGQTLGEFFRFPTAGVAGVVAAMHGSRVFTVNTAFSVTATLVLTMQTPAGTVTQFGSATSPFTVTVEDCGPISQFPNAPVLV